jgi:hypothetical protein
MVATESDFLAKATSSSRLQISGKELSSWAEEFCRIRGIEHRELVSPTEKILRAAPDLPDDQAAELAAAIGPEAAKLGTRPALRDVLQLLFPDGPWKERPGRGHAARYLLWLFRTTLLPSQRRLVQYQAESWRKQCEAPYDVFYKTADPTEAEQLLGMWLGLEEGAATGPLEPFPLDLDEGLRKWIRKKAKQEVHRDPLRCVKEKMEHGVRRDVLQILAEEALQILKARRSSLDRNECRVLEHFLPLELQAELRELCPPPEPSMPPSEYARITEWFVTEYLPYRQWQVEQRNEEARLAITRVADAFAKWLLSVYPAALTGSDLLEEMAIKGLSHLGQVDNDSVRLVIMLDGLNYVDYKFFVDRLLTVCPRLSLVDERITISPIPTITSVAKQAILLGLQPRQVEFVAGASQSRFREEMPEGKNRDSILREPEKRSTYLWTTQEPDCTYHKQADSEVLLTSVRGKLEALARQVDKQVRRIPESVKLEVVICTDHGRLLEGGKRVLEPPVGMEAHGRAAYGTGKGEAGGQPWRLLQDGQVALLSADYYGLSADACVVLTDDVFRTADGRGGEASFPHGGLFPEEVLIPWGRLARDAAKPKLNLRVTGQGRSGAAGTLLIELDNLNDYTVVVESFSLESSGGLCLEFPLVVELHARGSFTEKRQIAAWPSARQCADCRVSVRLRTATGAPHTQDGIASLESQEIYTPTPLLDDL